MNGKQTTDERADEMMLLPEKPLVSEWYCLPEN